MLVRRKRFLATALLLGAILTLLIGIAFKETGDPHIKPTASRPSSEVGVLDNQAIASTQVENLPATGPSIPKSPTPNMVPAEAPSPVSEPAQANEDRFQLRPEFARLLEETHPELSAAQRSELAELIARALQKHLPDDLTGEEKKKLYSSVRMLATDLGGRSFQEESPEYELDLLATTHQVELAGAVFSELREQGGLDGARRQAIANDYSAIVQETVERFYDTNGEEAAALVARIEPNLEHAGTYFFEPLFQFPLSEAEEEELAFSLETAILEARQRAAEFADNMAQPGFTADVVQARVEQNMFTEAVRLQALAYRAHGEAVPPTFWDGVSARLGEEFQRDEEELSNLQMANMEKMP